ERRRGASRGREHRHADPAAGPAGCVPAPRQPRAVAGRGRARRGGHPQFGAGPLARARDPAAGRRRALTGAPRASVHCARIHVRESPMRLSLSVLLLALAPLAFAGNPTTHGAPIPNEGAVVPISVAAADAEAYA